MNLRCFFLVFLWRFLWTYDNEIRWHLFNISFVSLLLLRLRPSHTIFFSLSSLLAYRAGSNILYPYIPSLDSFPFIVFRFLDRIPSARCKCADFVVPWADGRGEKKNVNSKSALCGIEWKCRRNSCCVWFMCRLMARSGCKSEMPKVLAEGGARKWKEAPEKKRNEQKNWMILTRIYDSRLK